MSRDLLTFPVTPGQRALLDSTAPRVLLRGCPTYGVNTIGLALAACRTQRSGGRALLVAFAMHSADELRARLVKWGLAPARWRHIGSWGMVSAEGGGTLGLSSWGGLDAKRKHGPCRFEAGTVDLVCMEFMPSWKQFQEIDGLLAPGGRLLVASCTALSLDQIQLARWLIRNGLLVDLHFPFSRDNLTLSNGALLVKNHEQMSPAELEASVAWDPQNPEERLSFGAEWP